MTTLCRRPTVLVAAAVVALGLGACSADEKPEPSAAGLTSRAVRPADAVSASLVGPGCAAYNAEVPSGTGSVQAMAVEPLPAAVGDSPLLKTFSAAMSGKFDREVNLTDRLNRGEYTLFAPVDAAFSKISVKTLKKW